MGAIYFLFFHINEFVIKHEFKYAYKIHKYVSPAYIPDISQAFLNWISISERLITLSIPLMEALTADKIHNPNLDQYYNL